MARDGVTYEQVAQAADALVGSGQQPTIRAVREHLGRGSPNTVHRHLQAWRDARPVPIASAPEFWKKQVSANVFSTRRFASRSPSGIR